MIQPGVYFIVHSPKTPWLQILTFVVLLAILGCLILIIAQQRAINEIDQIVKSSYIPQIIEASPGPDSNNGSEELTAPPPLRLPSLKRATNGVPPARSSTPLPQPPPTIISQVNQLVLEDGPVFPTAVLEEVVATSVVDSGNGSITGKIILRGSPPPELSIDFNDPLCGSMHSAPATTRHYVVSSDHGLGNVLVYVKSGLENNRFRIPTNALLLDNVGCFFEPYVMAVQAGQTFESAIPIRRCTTFAPPPPEMRNSIWPCLSKAWLRKRGSEIRNCSSALTAMCTPGCLLT